MVSAVDAGGFGIYVHWPFCQAKCPYCDFNSHVANDIDQDAWADAFISELRRYAGILPSRIVDSIFFGGGTPSLMSAKLVERILSCIAECWSINTNVEVSLEANPTSVEAGRFRDYADAGVNRVSLGIQSLKDDDLKQLGRLHSALDALNAFDIARANFSRVSFDLIYGRQFQTISNWEVELQQALSLAVDHLSLYQLTIEDGTAFGLRHAAGGLAGLPDDATAADMYAMTQGICADAGFSAYEVSNHSRPSAECRHNLVYWRGGDYVGIGPGAHGRLNIEGNRYATETPLAPDVWLQQVSERGSGESRRDPISTSEQADEYLMMSLRLAEGAVLDRYNSLSDHRLSDQTIEELQADGLLVRNRDRLVATPRGRIVLNSLLTALLR